MTERLLPAQERLMLSAGNAPRENSGSVVMELSEIRGQIDSIDSEIINLFAKRAELVSAAGKRKKKMSKTCAPEIAERVYRTIIDCFINKELLEFNQRDENQ